MVRRLPPLNALRAFEAAARHMSFSKAADELHVTPAAISHQVKALEDVLGVTLFRRLVRSLALTDAGRTYLPNLTRGLDHIARATEQLRGRGLAGRLTLSVMPSFAMRWLVPLLPDFHAAFPDIDLVVRAEPRKVDFDTEDVDAAIRYGPATHPGLRADLLMREEIFPVCSPALVQGPRAIRTLADVRHHPLIHDFDASAAESWFHWETWIREHGLGDVDPTRGLRFSDSSLMLEAATLGLGVALGRSAIMGDLLASGRLVRPVAEAHDADHAYWIVSPERLADEPKVAALRDWLIGVATTRAA
jgi:LysR family glycine cleavage system transcriptional activator